jgi:fructose-1-phosphate kinase PfkB-like protein
VVGVVGEDYRKDDFQLLVERGVDVSGIEVQAGKTFYWKGSYLRDLNEAETLTTELNVFEHFNPLLNESFAETPFVFLANIHPSVQKSVLSQVRSPIWVGMDTMNLWINTQKKELEQVISKVDGLFVNEKEATILTGTVNAIEAARKVMAYGPRTVVIKRGEYGFVLYTRDGGFHILPSYPIEKVIDPTGAGDSFAGAFVGYISSLGRRPTDRDFRRACVYGSTVASFTIQDFGIDALRRLNRDQVEVRLIEMQKLIEFQ